jgi:hypothetical protein
VTHGDYWLDNLLIMAVVASQIVRESDRSEAMFAAMATRHLQHALDLDSYAAI